MATYCKKCGNIVMSEEKFCGQCGEKVIDESKNSSINADKSKYHCPICNKELTKGIPSRALVLGIGPIFSQLFKPLICLEHGKISISKLNRDEKRRIYFRRGLSFIITIVVFSVIFAIFGDN